MALRCRYVRTRLAYILSKERIMPTFAVQRELPGISMEQLGAAQRAAIETSRKLSSEGTPVQYIRSNFYPTSSKCTCLFEASDAAAVELVNKEAGIPFVRVEQVLDLVPTGA